MSSANQYLGRARWRQSQRGATVFVVMLVMMLLTGLGLFAVRSASLATMAGGYGRQLSQTHFVTDYAMVTTLAEIIAHPDAYAKAMTRPPITAGCAGQENLKDPSCLKLSYDDLQAKVQQYNNNNQLLIPASFSDSQKMNLTAPGSLGPAPVEGDMKVEISDYHRLDWPVAGFSATAQNSSSQQFVMVTVSATGMVRPEQASSNTWDTASATAAGIETSRAHMILTVNK